MIAELKQIQRGLEDLNANFNDIVLALIKDMEKEVIEMNVDDQLFEGINARGETIIPPYSVGYRNKKKRMGLPFDRVTTRLEGDYHKSWFIIYNSDSFEFDASDAKKRYLDRRYSEKLYGLTDENKKKLANMLLPQLIEAINKKIYR